MITSSYQFPVSTMEKPSISVDMSGTCFLCLCDEKTWSKFSLKSLARLLKLSLAHNKGVLLHLATPMNLGDVDIDVHLCQCCSDVMEEFSSLYFQYDLIRVGMQYCVRKMEEILDKSTTSERRVRFLQKKVLETKDSERLTLPTTVGNALRREILIKCKAQNELPRVKLTKLNQKELTSWKRSGFKREEIKTSTGITFSSDAPKPEESINSFTASALNASSTNGNTSTHLNHSLNTRKSTYTKRGWNWIRKKRRRQYTSKLTKKQQQSVSNNQGPGEQCKFCDITLRGNCHLKMRHVAANHLYKLFLPFKPDSKCESKFNAEVDSVLEENITKTFKKHYSCGQCHLTFRQRLPTVVHLRRRHVAYLRSRLGEAGDTPLEHLANPAPESVLNRLGKAASTSHKTTGRIKFFVTKDKLSNDPQNSYFGENNHESFVAKIERAIQSKMLCKEDTDKTPSRPPPIYSTPFPKYPISGNDGPSKGHQTNSKTNKTKLKQIKRLKGLRLHSAPMGDKQPQAMFKCKFCPTKLRNYYTGMRHYASKHLLKLFNPLKSKSKSKREFATELRATLEENITKNPSSQRYTCVQCGLTNFRQKLSAVVHLRKTHAHYLRSKLGGETSGKSKPELTAYFALNVVIGLPSKPQEILVKEAPTKLPDNGNSNSGGALFQLQANNADLLSEKLSAIQADSETVMLSKAIGKSRADAASKPGLSVPVVPVGFGIPRIGEICTAALGLPLQGVQTKSIEKTKTTNVRIERDVILPKVTFKKRRMQFECQLCQKLVPRGSRQTHRRFHSQSSNPLISSLPKIQYSVQCKMCGKVLRSYNNANRHVIAAHKYNVLMPYENLRKELTGDFREDVDKLFQNHVGTTATHKIKCALCEYVDISRVVLGVHLITRHGRQMYSSFTGKPWEDGVVEPKLILRSLLEDHLLTNASDGTVLRKPEMGNGKVPKQITKTLLRSGRGAVKFGKIKFTCHLCNRVFHSLRGLNIHKSRHVDQKWMGRVKCTLCPATAVNKWSMEHHFLQHHPDKLLGQYKADDITDAQFKSNVKQAVRLMSSGGKCTVCGQVYSRIAICENHVMKMHSDVVATKLIQGQTVTSQSAPEASQEVSEKDCVVGSELDNAKVRKQREVAELFKCVYCGKRFGSKYSHSVHLFDSHKLATLSKHLPNLRNITEAQLEDILPAAILRCVKQAELQDDGSNRRREISCAICGETFSTNGDQAESESMNHVLVMHLDRVVCNLKEDMMLSQDSN